MHKLFLKQAAKARQRFGSVDVDMLGELVSAAYDEADRDRRRTERSMALMIEELDQLTRGLERVVEERTAELRESQDELQAQNRRFGAAVGNMSQGLVMFDAEGRLVICNQRYLEMYGLSPEAVKPGCTLQEIMKQRTANGSFAEDAKAYTSELAKRMAEGRPLSRLTELSDGRIITIFNQPMMDGGWVSTHEDVTERKRAEQKIVHMARHDALTDLPNRVLFRERLGEALSGVHRGERLAVLYLDLDHFKTVNDTLGHPVGDDLLKVVAERLQGCLSDTDMVARVGGDEFAIIQTHPRMPSETAVLARRLCEAVKTPYDLDGHAAVVDVSIGIAMAPTDGVDPNELLKNADMALYRAKADGRGAYRFFEPEMDERMKKRRALELALRNALGNREFELYYQPILHLDRNRFSSCEALIRWHHPERGMVSPAEFIPVAEEIGLITPLGEWVLRQACADAVRWPDEIKVAVNLSPTQLASRNLVPLVVSALAASGLPARRLEVEITEEVLMQNTEATLATLHQLREIGVRIALDDFGTGYSSLSYLRSFPFDKMKIDRCFIKGLPEGESAAIVRAVAGLANSLNMATIAEGVETEEQLAKVHELGCTHVQGFLISKPKPMQEIQRLLGGTEAPRAAAGAA